MKEQNKSWIKEKRVTEIKEMREFAISLCQAVSRNCLCEDCCELYKECNKVHGVFGVRFDSLTETLGYHGINLVKLEISKASHILDSLSEFVGKLCPFIYFKGKCKLLCPHIQACVTIYQSYPEESSREYLNLLKESENNDFL